MRRFYFFGIIYFFIFCGMYAQTMGESVKLSYNGSRNYYLVERTDLRRYDNGKYTGLVSREVRSFISRATPPANANPLDSYYDGSFFVEEGTRRGFNDVGEGIHDSISSAFRITSDGQLFMIEDNGYPSFRSFPSFPAEKIKVGEKWVSKAERAVDPLYKGIVTKIPMTIEYTYLRDETFHGEEVYVLAANWATRYGISYFDFGGDKQLKSATGKHSATMFISKQSGNALVVRDSVDETFLYTDGKQVSFKGTISLFTEYPPAVDRTKILPTLQRVAKLTNEEVESISKPKSTQTKDAKGAISGKISSTLNKPSHSDAEKPITVENTEAGIRLTMQNLQFKADSDELLPGENQRLDQIAQILKEVPNSQFLVEGHTASTGNPKGEQELSEKRAKTIATELSKRGIAAGRFICKGSGGRKPIASNETSQGKAKNRRVEITILE